MCMRFRARRACRSLFGSLRPELERACLSGLGQEVQAAAVDTLCLAAFVLLEDEHQLQGVLRHVQGLWPRGALRAPPLEEGRNRRQRPTRALARQGSRAGFGLRALAGCMQPAAVAGM